MGTLIQPLAWELPAWHGPDRASLAGPWAAKPKVAVCGLRSCAELAVLDRLAGSGWRGVWVSAWGGKLRTGFPEPAYSSIKDAGAPPWAARVFDALFKANGGYSGFFDVFAWREPGEIMLAEVKVGKNQIRPGQLRFASLARAVCPEARLAIIEAHVLS